MSQYRECGRTACNAQPFSCARPAGVELVSDFTPLSPCHRRDHHAQMGKGLGGRWTLLKSLDIHL